MFTTEVNGTRHCLPVGGMPGILNYVSLIEKFVREDYQQPVNDFDMSELENELIDHAVDSYCATHEF